MSKQYCFLDRKYAGIHLVEFDGNCQYLEYLLIECSNVFWRSLKSVLQIAQIALDHPKHDSQLLE